MVDANDSQGDLDEFAPRHILEAHTVAELTEDFTDRVMASLHVSAPRRSSPRPALSWIITACASAIAVAAMLMVVLDRDQARDVSPAPLAVAPAVAPTPTPTAAPLLVAAPTPSPDAALGHLVLAVEPKDALVWVDGAPVVGPSPFVATNLPPGAHLIVIERDGHTPWSRQLQLPEGTLELSIELTPVPTRELPTREVPTRSSGPATAPATASPDLLDPFAHRDDRLEPARGSSAVAEPAGQDPPDMKDPFSAEPTGEGTLRIGVEVGAAPAEVFVDGKSVGFTPIASLRVQAGLHKVRWEWNDGRKITKRVSVEADVATVIKAG